MASSGVTIESRRSPRGIVRYVSASAVAAVALAVGAGGVEAQGDRDCGARASLQVVVVDDTGALTIPGATVVLRWTDSDAVRRPVRQEVRADGRLSLCAPRDARQATLWAELGDASSEEAVVAIEPGVSHDVELRLRLASERTGRIIGQVWDALSEDPVAVASVSVVGRAEEVQTNRRGRFILSGVPVGEYGLTVRRLGYAPLTHPVTVSRGVTTEVDVGLVPDPVEMEPLVATATRVRRLEVQGFYERKYWGELVSGGTFFTATDIERRNPTLISHMIADAPGIFLGNCGMRHNNCQLLNSRISSGFSDDGCPLNVYIDGILIRGPSGRSTGKPDHYVKPVEIAGVEVYRGAASLPGEFSGSDARCGVVAIWTK